MQLHYVSSSNLSCIGYENGVLEIHFKNNTVYHYFNVPEWVFNGLLDAHSKGEYHAQHIKNSYTYQRVR
ncbi:KTSC domain-containing protein [Alysiella crassa]|uniref:KTSC domain-containing protein n=1 Tax=Alysiella crassa TaxID=153491 RepID=UPI000551DBA5|nr:KTSC domain-containing protein [Alysiella crassa]UOP06533.1 KTSC domain-containing protein [Alysiella crassa]